MITDKLSTFASDLALGTHAPGTAVIGDVMDLGTESFRDIGSGTPLYLVISMASDATSGGSAIGSFELVSDDNTGLTSPTVHFETSPTAVADMTEGTTIAIIALPMEGIEYERYLGLRQVTAGAAFTGGTFNAFLTLTPQNWKPAPEYDGV